MAGETPSVKITHTEPPPPDKLLLIHVLAAVCGFAVLFVSSTLIINVDYYADIYGHEDGEQLIFLISLCIALSSPFVQLLFTQISNKISYSSRIFTCFGANTILAMVFPLILNTFPTSISYWLALIIALTVGVNNAILKQCTLSMFAFFPPKFSHVLVIGKGISPLLVISLKIMQKLYIGTLPKADQPHAIRTTTVVLFFVAALVPFIACVLYRVGRKTIFSKYYFPNFRARRMLLDANASAHTDHHLIVPAMDKMTENENQSDDAFLEDCDDTEQQQFTDASQISLLDLDLNVQSINGGSYDYQPINDDPSGVMSPTTEVETVTMKSVEVVSKMVVLKKIALPLLLMTLIWFVPYSIYPGILNKPHSTIDGLDNSWYHVLSLFIFTLSVFLSTLLPYQTILKICPINRVDVVIYLRILFIPIFYYCAYVHAFATQIVWLLVFIMAFSHGIVLVIVIRNYQHLVSDGERSTAGSLMSVSIVTGVAFANILAVFVEKVISKL